MLPRYLTIALVVFALAAICGEAAFACPTCKEGMTDDPQAASMVQGYFWSIVFMMSMPFLIFGGLGTYFYLLVRKARAAQAVGTVTPALAPESALPALSK